MQIDVTRASDNIIVIDMTLGEFLTLRNSVKEAAMKGSSNIEVVRRKVNLYEDFTDAIDELSGIKAVNELNNSFNGDD